MAHAARRVEAKRAALAAGRNESAARTFVREQELDEMLAVGLIGALLFAGGIVYTGIVAARRGRMSDPRTDPVDPSVRTLEPRDRGLGFLGWKETWPGILMLVVGGMLLLVPVLLTAQAS